MLSRPAHGTAIKPITELEYPNYKLSRKTTPAILQNIYHLYRAILFEKFLARAGAGTMASPAVAV
jgi:hypothetical protein